MMLPMMQLQQGSAAGGKNFRGQFALQNSWGADVRFGSTADIVSVKPDVRFTPNSGRR
jgi:hypothetical protein